MLFSSVVPSPLYGTYRELWGFSTVTLTLVYATYAFGVLTTLLLAGRLSDTVGRRPVLLVALAGLSASAVVFAVAPATGWLFVARAIQGLSTGLVLAAASAALLDLHPRRDATAVARANGIASAVGMGLGVLVSAALVELAPAPRVTPYLLLLALFLAALAGVWRMPEPVAHRGRVRLTPQRPRVPRAVRGPFLVAALGVTAAWSVNGLFLSLGPRLATDILDHPGPLAGGAPFVLLAAAAALVQLVVPRRGAALGGLVLAAGMLVMVVAVETHQPALLLAGAVVEGAGFGIAYLGGLRVLSAAIPADQRAATMAAFYLVAYGALSVPAVLAGLATAPLGLHPTFAAFGLAVAATALLTSAAARAAGP